MLKKNIAKNNNPKNKIKKYILTIRVGYCFILMLINILKS